MTCGTKLQRVPILSKIEMRNTRGAQMAMEVLHKQMALDILYKMKSLPLFHYIFLLPDRLPIDNAKVLANEGMGSLSYTDF